MYNGFLGAAKMAYFDSIPIDHQFIPIAIGKDGSFIEDVQKVEGVKFVSIRTEQTEPYALYQVWAEDKDLRDKIFAELQNRIRNVSRKFDKFFIDSRNTAVNSIICLKQLEDDSVVATIIDSSHEVGDEVFYCIEKFQSKAATCLQEDELRNGITLEFVFLKRLTHCLKYYRYDGKISTLERV